MKLEIKNTTQIYSYLSTGIHNKYTSSNMNRKEHKMELNTYRNKKWVSVQSLLQLLDKDNLCYITKERLYKLLEEK